MPPKPRWLLAIPDAISQLEKLDRSLLTRRDIERLFGVSTARAATLMQTFGAEMTGCQRTLPRTKLLRQLRKHRARSAFRGEVERRDRLVAELRKARVTGIRVTLPAETLECEVGPRSRWSDGEADVVLPALIVDAGPDAVQRFLEFFAGRIANERTRAAYGRAAGQFLARREASAWVAAASREGRKETRRAGPPPARRGPRCLPPSSAGSRTGGGEADREGVDAAGCPRHDQASGGGRWAPSLDLLPHVPERRGTAYLSNGGTLEHAQQIAGHASADNGDGRRDRTHRDLNGKRRAAEHRGRRAIPNSSSAPEQAKPVMTRSNSPTMSADGARAGSAPALDMFALRDSVVDKYKQFATSFTTTHAPTTSASKLRPSTPSSPTGPEPLIQINPGCKRSIDVGALAANGVVDPGCADISRANGEPLSLYKHQEQAVALAAEGETFVVTTGTGSGRSLCFFIPIVSPVLDARRPRAQRGIHAIVVYPMNALANSPDGGDRQVRLPRTWKPVGHVRPLYRAGRRGRAEEGRRRAPSKPFQLSTQPGTTSPHRPRECAHAQR